MAKPNYGFQKRQKELARQKKQEEKKQRKLEKAVRPEEGQEQAPAGTDQAENPSADAATGS